MIIGIGYQLNLLSLILIIIGIDYDLALTTNGIGYYGYHYWYYCWYTVWVLTSVSIIGNIVGIDCWY